MRERYLTAKEVAELTGFSTASIYAKCKKKQLPTLVDPLRPHAVLLPRDEMLQIIYGENFEEEYASATMEMKKKAS